MESSLTQIPVLRVLAREYLFSGLEQYQLEEIAGWLERVEFPRGAMICSETQPADCFYIVLSGKVRLIFKQGNKERKLGVLMSGDFFGETALLNTGRSAITAVTLAPTVLLKLRRDSFLSLIGKYPQIHRKLIAIARSRELVRKLGLDWLGPDEVIYYLARKHGYFLVLGLLLPFSTALLGILIIAFQLFGGLVTSLIMGGIFLLAALVLAWWRWVDWGNDYFVLTSNRVLRHEKVLGLYDNQLDAPLGTIVAVDSGTSLWGRLLKYGSVDVRTLTGGVRMQRVNHPTEFVAFVEGYRQRIRLMSREEEIKLMRRNVRRAIQKDYSPLGDLKDTQQSKPREDPNKKKGSREWWRTFLRVRFERDGVITYRKHWFILLGKIWRPLIFFLLSLILMVWLMWQRVLDPVIISVGFLVLLGFFAWLAYEYADWSNDIYQLTPTQIVDIEKKPLGREQKKTAPLDAPDFRVEHERKNFIAVLLDFGEVVINVGQTPFIFYGVSKPDMVHHDVSDYRAALLEKKRQEEERKERERMRDWIAVYHREVTGELGEMEDDFDEDGFLG